jgi:hypothetical protein
MSTATQNRAAAIHYQRRDTMSTFTDSIEHNMKGLTAISTGICPGCQECADTHADGDVEKLQRLWETGLADEASFSHSACECCGSHLGGDRAVAHALDSKNEIIHMDGFCMDCVFYFANGDEPEN